MHTSGPPLWSLIAVTLSRLSFSERPDVLGAYDDVIKPDAVDGVGIRHSVLSGGVFGDIVQQPEEVDLQVRAGPPAKALERLTALIHQDETHPGPLPTLNA